MTVAGVTTTYCKARLVFRAVMSLVCAAAIAVLALVLRRKMPDTSGYVSATGKVVGGYVTSKTVDTSTEFEVSYQMRYVVNGKEYTVAYDDGSSRPTMSAAEELLAARKGRVVPLFYDPKAPANYVTTRNREDLIFWGLVAAAGVCVVVGGVSWAVRNSKLACGVQVASNALGVLNWATR